jgi:hypothetical protein
LTTKLQVYNNALSEYLGERKLASLTENRKPRRLLDQAWDSDFVKGVLEMGLWNFATRTVSSDYSPSVDPDFGYQYAHDKPTDWVRTSAISLDEYFRTPLTEYNDEQGYLFLDAETVYWRYISDDSSYGSDLSIWPESFTALAECELAKKICRALTQSDTDRDRLEKMSEKLLRNAKAKDAMNDPPKFPPTGSWLRARRGARRNPPTNIRTI